MQSSKKSTASPRDQAFGHAGPLLCEIGAPGRSAVSLPPLDVPEVDVAHCFGSQARLDHAPLPELSELDVVRHFLRLSQANFAIDRGMVPLGSCTMKYNPKVNEWAARLPGFAQLHPLMPDALVQGALALMYALEQALAEICGMDGVSLHPAAGAQGELVGLKMIRAYHQSKGRDPRSILVPDTAHGTNSASCALAGFRVVPFQAGPGGIVRVEDVAPHLNDDTAAIMVTNPNTLGLFESHLADIAASVHEVGGMVYGDGANLNALLGKVRPGDLGIDIMQFNLHKTFTTPHGGGGPGCGPVAFREHLAPFAPIPVVRRVDKASAPSGCDADIEGARFVLDDARPQSIGRMRSFQGNFGMMVRAYSYIREMGAEGLRQVSEQAVLAANYLHAGLSEHWHAPYARPCMHECILSDRTLKDTGVSTLDVAKRLIDHGFHAPTMYFPLVVKGAMLIEPTETESKETLDAFVEAMAAIAREAQEQPEGVTSAPTSTPLRRIDETRAARQPKLRW